MSITVSIPPPRIYKECVDVCCESPVSPRQAATIPIREVFDQRDCLARMPGDSVRTFTNSLFPWLGIDLDQGAFQNHWS